ncbi:MAG: hypothetical protein JST85_26735 [Acidobacteria bacterium]|nr:hypothetical protein [Acidobacteriota bacterium]
MSEILNPDGSQISVAGVELSALGFGGIVEVHLPGGMGMRAAEDAQPTLLGALNRSGFLEQLTVEIAEPRFYPEYVGGGGRGRDASVGTPEISVTVPGPGTGFAQVLLACDEDGVLTWHLPSNVAPSEVVVRGAEQLTYHLPARIVEGVAGGNRGLMGALGKKLLKVLAFELADKVLGVTGNYFVSRYEQAHMHHRLRWVTAENYRNGEVRDLDSEDLRRLTSGRALLFIHGTASRAHKAFATLPRGFVSDMENVYGGRVFAFDHPTLSITPAENVRWLANAIERLPANPVLDIDIISHSRGGLVGRLMCERASDVGVDPKRLRVRTLVMVATPNAGTPLADRKHLGSFVDTLTNLLEFIPDNPATDTLDLVLELLKQLAVGVMGGLEGLRSMEPQGEFLHKLLNQPSEVSAVYRAIAANYDPGPNTPLGRYARDFLTDLVFLGEPNDLVVPTNGVFAANGATPFPISSTMRIEATEAVDHSGFWNKPATIEALSMWLEH